MVDHALEKIVLDLYRDNKWKEIISLDKNTKDEFEKHRLLWVWPSFEDLNWFKTMIDKKDVSEIVSIGCGSGLLEWIIQNHLGITVVGVEIDRKWWSSGYSPPLFLDNIRFVDEDDNFQILPSQVILFCYFNNGPAFINYMKKYEGRTVIVIGPGEGRGSCTDPTPFDKKFRDLGWELDTAREIRNTKDYIAVYVR